MKKTKTVASAVMNVLLVASIVLCAMVAVQVLNRGYATLAGHSMFRVVTGSMEPTIPVGGLVVAKETPIEEVAIGDIICFRAKEQAIYGEIITHRVVEKMYAQDGELFLETRGDANPVADSYLVSAENLVGQVILYTGNRNMLSRIVTMLTTKYGFFACVLLPVLVMAIMIMKDSVKSIRKELRKMQQELEHPVPGEETFEAKGLFTQEEYEELVARLKQEILEEMSQHAQMEDVGDIHG